MLECCVYIYINILLEEIKSKRIHQKSETKDHKSEGQLTSPAESLPRTVDSGAPGGYWSGLPRWSPKNHTRVSRKKLALAGK